IITEKDKRDISFVSDKDVDYVALSFVQTAGDIANLRKSLKSLGNSAKIIAKIETHAAVENIEWNMDGADVAMIARGDWAGETPAGSVPGVQRQIIGLGREQVNPTVVATQLMASMTHTPDPPRAEVSDVRPAVIVGAHCVMLSEETAGGN